jgi:surfeit locus 1 family protein
MVNAGKRKVYRVCGALSFTDYTFRPTWTATLLTMLAVGVFSGLSVWQVERAFYKLDLAREILQKQAQAPLELSGITVPAGLDRYRSVAARGHFETSDYVLIDNSVQQGRAGFQVVAPFQLEGSKRHVLVYVGWVPLGRTRSDLPQIELPKGPVTIHGRLGAPGSRPVLVSSDTPNPEFERVWMYMDTVEFAKRAGYEVMPLVLYQSRDDAGQYSREWPEYDARVGMHVGYAIQWGVFALVALGLYIWIGLKKGSKQDE